MYVKPICLLLFVIACGRSEQPVAEPLRTEPAPVAPEAEAPPVYDVHEWGLINMRDGRMELAAGPGRQTERLEGLHGQGYGKPVLYFSTEETAPFDVRIGVELNGFRLAEHFPPGIVVEHGLRWNTEVSQSRCAASPAYPTVEGPGGIVDDYCEASELLLYETPTSACVRVGDAAAPLLFYRGTPSDSPPVLALQVMHEGQNVRVTRSSPGTSVGTIWHLRGTEVVGLTEWPSISENATFEGEPPTDPRALMLRELVAHGLTPEEADAFGRAWFDELFGPAPATIGGSPTGDGESGGESGMGVGRGGLLGPMTQTHHSVLYWLPREVLDALAPVVFDPPPQIFARATLVRLEF